MRQSLISLINQNPGFEIIGEAQNGKELVDLCNVHKPDIILTDLEMPVMSGIVAVEKIREKFPEHKIIVLSNHGGDYFISEMILRGVNAYLLKNCDAELLFLTIQKVHDEGFYFSDSISRNVISSSLEQKIFASVYNQIALSPRETEVLKHTCNEKTNLQIADLLSISEPTVEFHKKNIYAKTEMDSITGLVKYAIRKGITGIS